MRYIRTIVALLLFFGSLLPLSGQNQPSQMDEDCYAYYRKADALVGTDAFKAVNDTLLRLSLQKGDTQAQNLFYVEKLKHQIALSKPTQNDEPVERAFHDLLEASQRLGYPQYYYMAYDLMQGYYYSTGRLLRSMETIQEMMNYSIEKGDEYGEWMADRFMVTLYVSQNDYVSAKKFIDRAIEIHDTTSDTLVTGRSLCRLYCDLADYYPIGADSVRICVSKAMAHREAYLDTLRCAYYQAKLAALDRDMETYREARDFCLASDQLSVITATDSLVFEIIDAIFDGTVALHLTDIQRLPRLRDWKYMAYMLQQNGYRNYALFIYRQLVTKLEEEVSINNQSRLAEVEARIGNISLEANLRQKSSQVTHISRLVYLLAVLTLLFVITFLLITILNFRKNRKRDAERIEELKEANAHAVAADEAKTQFVQNMSHEIRTPLNAIVGFSQLLSLPDGSFPEAEKEGFATHIVNNAQMLTMLLDDILNASAIDNNEYRIVYEEGEMHFLCKAAISSAEHRLQPGVQLYYKPESEEPFVFRTDPRRVQQILINMLTNACKHTMQGEIVLSSSLSANPGYVTFSVTDTGTGVPPEQAEVIFERFVKLNGFVQGTGLGLSICREIAKRMGAQIYLDTTYTAGGARFIFMVPVTPPEEQTTIQNPQNNQ